MNDVIYWIWLQKAMGIGASLHSDEIIAAFPSAKQLYEASDIERRIAGVFSNRQLAALEETSLAEAENIWNLCQEKGISAVTPESDDYPALLRQLIAPPLVLYYQGDLSCLKKVCVSVVGTRKSAKRSFDIAASLSASMARAGVTIVSGGAMGIDSAAHTGALSEQGKTVAVLGCGIAYPYLEQNRALRMEIAQKGLLLSEYPPLHPAGSYTFPVRNRIIAGLSYGTVVIEAGEHSGSLITARYATEQGRDVFAVPGDLTGSTFLGANSLIRSGAKPVFCAADVLENYALRFGDLLPMDAVETQLNITSFFPEQQEEAPKPKPKKAPAKKKAKPAEPPVTNTEHLSACSEDAKALYAVMPQSPTHVDDLARISGIPMYKLFAILTELELNGLLQVDSGRLYQKL